MNAIPHKLNPKGQVGHIASGTSEPMAPSAAAYTRGGVQADGARPAIYLALLADIAGLVILCAVGKRRPRRRRDTGEPGNPGWFAPKARPAPAPTPDIAATADAAAGAAEPDARAARDAQIAELQSAPATPENDRELLRLTAIRDAIR